MAFPPRLTARELQYLRRYGIHRIVRDAIRARRLMEGFDSCTILESESDNSGQHVLPATN